MSMKKRKIRHARAPFHLLCKPIGARCNLRCAHCFYLEKADLYPDETQWRMPPDVLERFTRVYIESQPEGVQEIQFAWQGGEPTLMGLDFFRSAVALQKRMARPGLTISNALQTNGTLLDDEWGKFLHEENFLVGLSVDGPEDIHNHFRPWPDGRGSFAAVMQGLEALKRNRVEFNTLTCVQSHNADHPLEVYEFLKSIGSTFLQFIPIVEPDGAGGLTPHTPSGKQWGAFMNAIFDRWLDGDVGAVFVQHFDALLGIVMGYPSSVCVHSRFCGRALVIEHNGDIYACDHFVTPAHKLGNIMDDSMAWMLDGEAQTRFGRDKSEKLPGQCQRCKYIGLCFGACPSDRLVTTAEGEPGLNAVCEGYFAMYEHMAPVLMAMARALHTQRPARDWMHFMG